MTDEVRRHCAEIERCNQRGGRMLSVVDLIDAGTLSRELAAYALAAIGGGASFLVGSVPGGAGKTTVMGALLNFVPRRVELVPADGMAAIERGLAEPEPRRCCICHEIGSGRWYAYLWGRELRAYFELPTTGHILATNLHADTYDQAAAQICGENAVPESALQRMNLMFFLAVRRSGFGVRRTIDAVWESDGYGPHRQVFDAGGQVGPSTLMSTDDLAAASRAMDQLIDSGARTIQQVRCAVLELQEPV